MHESFVEGLLRKSVPQSKVATRRRCCVGGRQKRVNTV